MTTPPLPPADMPERQFPTSLCPTCRARVIWTLTLEPRQPPTRLAVDVVTTNRGTHQLAFKDGVVRSRVDPVPIGMLYTAHRCTTTPAKET